MNSWHLQDAKARFSEFLAAVTKGPQIVTWRGVESAVLVSMEEWKRLQLLSRAHIKDLLLGDAPRIAAIVPRRGRWRRRPALDFSEPQLK